MQEKSLQLSSLILGGVNSAYDHSSRGQISHEWVAFFKIIWAIYGKVVELGGFGESERRVRISHVEKKWLSEE